MSDIFNAHINEETNEGQTVKEHSEKYCSFMQAVCNTYFKRFHVCHGTAA